VSRYDAVARAAEELLDDLQRSYRVLVTSVSMDDWPEARATRLVPAGDGSPLTIGVLPDRRVVARRGHWDAYRFPMRDDDSLDEVVEGLRGFVAATVEGTFTEELRPDGLVVRDPYAVHANGLREPEYNALARRATPGTHTWAPWRG